MVHKSVLTNGIRVVSERIPSRTVSVGFWIDAGSRDETPAESGCAHFVEHMLFKGTASRSNEDIARQLDRLGGMSNAFTTRENTCLYATVLDDQLGELLSLFAEMLTHSRFAAAEVERERQVILQEIGMVEDSPEDLSHDLFLANLWGDHPLGRTILGQREAVASMTARRLKGFCRRMHVPANLLVAAAGQVDHAALVRLVETALAVSLPEPPAKAGGVPRIAPRARSGVALHPRRFEQTHVILGVEGLPVRSPDRYALNLLNILLGGNMSSRLFQEVREKRGLAYNIYSFVESEGDSGLVGLYTAVAPAALGQALEVIREVVGRMCEREVPGQ